MPLAAGRILAVDGARDRLIVEHRGIGRYYIDPGKTVIYVRDHDLLRRAAPVPETALPVRISCSTFAPRL